MVVDLWRKIAFVFDKLSARILRYTVREKPFEIVILARFMWLELKQIGN